MPTLTADEQEMEVGVPEIDPEDYVEDLITEDSEYSAFPKEYVALLTGIKGAGKGLSLARILFRAMYYKYPVWTNVQFYPEKLLELGIKEEFLPKPLDIEFMLTFDESLQTGVIGIDEIDTWIIKMKSNSNLNILMASFMKQLRKRDVKVFGALHFDDAIPGEIHNEVDLIINCNDAFYTAWGKEQRVPRGKLIFQHHFDYSGVFTGKRRNPIGEFFIAHSEKLWDVYNSYQTLDPFVGFQKVQFEGNEITLDLSGAQQDNIAQVWRMPLIELVTTYPRQCKTSIRSDGVHHWMSFNPRSTAQLSSPNANHAEICENLETIRGMRTKPFIKMNKNARGKVEIQILPDMVPELQAILKDTTNAGPD